MRVDETGGTLEPGLASGVSRVAGPMFGPSRHLPTLVQDLSPFTPSPKAPAVVVTVAPLLASPSSGSASP